MVEKLIGKIFEERDDFWAYVMMMENCEKEEHKAIFKKIAEEEHGHFKMLKEMLFKDMTNMTDMEKAFHKMLVEECDKMKEVFNK